MKTVIGHVLALYVVLVAVTNVLVLGGYAVAWLGRIHNNEE